MLAHNSLSSNDLTNLRQPTKDFVRNFHLFMQNEPKLRKPEMTINYCTQRTYKVPHLLEPLKNEPKRTQNEPKLKNAKMIIFHYLKRTYNNFRYFELFKNEPKRTQNEPKTNPISKDPHILVFLVLHINLQESCLENEKRRTPTHN